MNDYTEEITRQTKIVTDTEDAMHAALEAATDTKMDYGTDAAARTHSYELQLTALKALISAKTSELAEATDADAKILKAEIAELAAQAENTRTKIEAIKPGTAKADPELVLTAVRAYAKASKAKADAAVALHRASDRVRSQIKQLNEQYVKLEKAARILSGRYSGITRIGIDSDATRLIYLYEGCFGEIDVAGHTCRNDTEAKFCFIKGIRRGLEKTGAAKALEALQAGQI